MQLSDFQQTSSKVTTENTYMFNLRFSMQSKGCTMGGPSSLTFSNIYRIKLKIDKVKPMKPLFYNNFADDAINRSKNINLIHS